MPSVRGIKEHFAQPTKSKDFMPSVRGIKEHFAQLTKSKDCMPSVRGIKEHFAQLTKSKDFMPSVRGIKEHFAQRTKVREHFVLRSGGISPSVYAVLGTCTVFRGHGTFFPIFDGQGTFVSFMKVRGHMPKRGCLTTRKFYILN